MFALYIAIAVKTSEGVVFGSEYFPALSNGNCTVDEIEEMIILRALSLTLQQVFKSVTLPIDINTACHVIVMEKPSHTVKGEQ
jgi:hypothetical protein